MAKIHSPPLLRVRNVGGGACNEQVAALASSRFRRSTLGHAMEEKEEEEESDGGRSDLIYGALYRRREGGRAKRNNFATTTLLVYYCYCTI